MHLSELLKRQASLMPDRTAVVYRDRPITYGEIARRVNRFANALSGLGLGEGDKVAIMLNNCPEFIVSYFACARLGAVAVPVNIFYKERELEYLLRDSDAAALIINPAFAEFHSRIAVKPPQMKWLISTGPYREGITFAELEEGPPGDKRGAKGREDAVIEILYTSGTTGELKGTMLTHGNLLFHARAIIDLLDLSDVDRALMVVPMFHGYGITVLICALISGSSFVLLDPFNPVEVFQAIEKHRVTFIPLVVAMYYVLLNHPERQQYDLSSLRVGISGASAMPAQLMRDCGAAFGIKILEAWGLTECSASATMQRLNAPYKEGSVGLAYPGVTVGVMDDDEKLLGPGVTGELVVRGPIMKGYYKKENETAEALHGGWLHTGDMGYCDEEGYFFIVDRKKELINIGGEKVFPREVEEIIYGHPAVAEAALVPQHDDKLGEVPVAVVALRPGASLSEGELIDFLVPQLARFKVPRKVIFMENLPRNPIGKILKKELLKILSGQA